jgi:hypothetical protein
VSKVPSLDECDIRHLVDIPAFRICRRVAESLDEESRENAVGLDVGLGALLSQGVGLVENLYNPSLLR